MKNILFMNKQVWIFIFAFLILASFNVSAKDYHWEEISTHVYFKENGNADVSEIQTFNFSGDFSYAFRYFHFDEIKEVREFHVYDEKGQEYQTVEYFEGKYKVFKWFYTAKDEKKTFILNYTLIGAVKQGLFQDKVFWTGVFKDHEKVVKNASIYIKFYSYNQEKINYQIYPDAESYLEDSTLVVKTISPLEPYIPLETIITAPVGVLTPEQHYILAMKIFLVLLSFLFVIFILLKYKKEYASVGKELKFNFTKEDYRGLKDLRPAIVGLLINGDVGNQDVFATITDLAQRGYIHVQVIKKFLSQDFELLRLRNQRDALLDYETRTLNMLFKTKDKILMSELKNNPSIKLEVDKIIEEIYAEASRQGLYEKNPRKARSNYQKKSILYFLIPLSWMSFILFSSTNSKTGIFLGIYIFVYLGLLLFGFLRKTIRDYTKKDYMIYLSLIFAIFVFSLISGENYIPLMNIAVGSGIISGIIILIYSKFMDKKTEIGLLNVQKYKELKDWMRKYPLKEERMFNEFLPYSIVFGIHKQWLKKFESSIADKTNKELSWYNGYSGSFSSSFYSFHLSSLSATSFGSHSGSGGGFGGSSGGGGGGSGGGGGGAG